MSLHPSVRFSGPYRSAAGIAIASIAVIFLVRLWMAVDVPLTDTTESRYGEMARKMVETGDWLVPQHDYGVPYLAKPPLAIWASAVGIELFGAGELGPRIPIFLVALAFLAWFYFWTRDEIGRNAALVGVIVLSGSLLFFVAMAAVMTDLILVVCVTAALIAFWSRMHKATSAGSEWVFWCMVGLGLLAKGPVALVFTGVPILAWAAIYRRFKETWRRMSWFRGAVLAAVIAAPWYVAAERSHPGFLRYFLIGEHVQRFLVSDWQGDLYGPVRNLPHGTILLFVLIGALPWSIVAPIWFMRRRQSIVAGIGEHRELAVFFTLAALAPLMLFTVAQNVIFPYALPILAPAVIAVLAVVGEHSLTPGLLRKAAMFGCAIPVVLLLGATFRADWVEQESERAMLAAAQAGAHDLYPIYYWEHRFYSADYYSGGQAVVLTDLADLGRVILSGSDFRVVMWDDDYANLPEHLRSALLKLGEYSKKALYGPAVAAPHAAVALERR